MGVASGRISELQTLINYVVDFTDTLCVAYRLQAYHWFMRIYLFGFLRDSWIFIRSIRVIWIRIKIMGRPTKFNEKVTSKILELVEKGAFHKFACMYVGITEQTLLNWLDLGENATSEKDPYYKFYMKFNRAKVERSRILLEEIASDPDWKAKKWLLEREWPELIDANKQVQISGKVEHVYTAEFKVQPQLAIQAPEDQIKHGEINEDDIIDV